MVYGEFTDRNSGYSVVFDDDGRVAYAYLLDDHASIVADVWLYNRCETPAQPESTSPENMPFANSLAFSKNHAGFSVVGDISDVSVRWTNGEIIEAQVLIRG